MVRGVAMVWVRAVREQAADARRPASFGSDAGGLPPIVLVLGVDRRSGCDELIDDGEALVVGGHHECSSPCLQRGLGRQPASHIACCRRLFDAVDAGPGVHQEIEDIGHAEHGCVQESRPTENAACIWRGPGLETCTGLDQHPCHIGVAVAGSGN